MRNEHFWRGLCSHQHFLHRMALADGQLMIRDFILFHRWFDCGAVILWWRRRERWHNGIPCGLDRLVYGIGPPESTRGEENNKQDRGARQNKPIGHPEAAGS